jgi:hypothetical protein
MTRYRILLTSLFLLTLLAFSPNHAQSKQYFDATIRFNPEAGNLWHYLTTVALLGDEVERGQRSQVGGIIWTVYDENVNSSGDGLVGMNIRFNIYEALDLGYASEYEDPTGGPYGPPSYASPAPNDPDQSAPSLPLFSGGHGDPLQSVGGPGGGGTGGGGEGGGGEGDLAGEGKFEVTPIMESNISYIMSESGRLLDVSGLELVGDIIDPSRSISVRQLFETVHFVVLPDYQVHLNESWRAPMSWTIPFVGETMQIPLTFTLADIRTTYRFRMAAIDFSGILQFNVDVSDEGTLADPDTGELRDVRKESNIQGDIIIQGRAYVDLDRGILVALCDTPALGNTYFVDGQRRGAEQYTDDVGLPWPLNPGFYANLSFERRDLYTPLGNVIDPRQELLYRIQELQWFTTTVVE